MKSNDILAVLALLVSLTVAVPISDATPGEVTGLEIREAKGGAGGGGGGGRGGGGRGGGARTGGRGSAGFLPGGRARSGPKADPDADDKTDKCNSFFDFIGFCD